MLRLPAPDRRVGYEEGQHIMGTPKLAPGRTVTRPGAVIDVISGAVAGVTGPALNHWPVQGAIVTVDPGGSVGYPLPANHRAFAHVLSGAVNIAGRATVAPAVSPWAHLGLSD